MSGWVSICRNESEEVYFIIFGGQSLGKTDIGKRIVRIFRERLQSEDSKPRLSLSDAFEEEFAHPCGYNSV